MQNTVTFNIETAPAERLPDLLLPQPPKLEDMKAPSNYKDADKIRDYRENALISAIAKQEEDKDSFALSPLRGQIICIGVKLNNEPAKIFFNPTDELNIIKEFKNWHAATNRYATWVGFNSKAFDVPYLYIACKRLGENTPFKFEEMVKKYSQTYHYDVRDQLTAFDSRKSGTLPEWAARFGVTPVYGKGEMVGTWYKAGLFDEIVKHCTSNIEATYDLYCKLEQPLGE